MHCQYLSKRKHPSVRSANILAYTQRPKNADILCKQFLSAEGKWIPACIPSMWFSVTTCPAKLLFQIRIYNSKAGLYTKIMISPVICCQQKCFMISLFTTLFTGGNLLDKKNNFHTNWNLIGLVFQYSKRIVCFNNTPLYICLNISSITPSVLININHWLFTDSWDMN